MITWAVRLPPAAAAGLGPLRFLPAAEAYLATDVIWLRGSPLAEADEALLRQLPGAERFQINARGELFPTGSLLPHGHLPPGDWQKLSRFIEVKLPATHDVHAAVTNLSLNLVQDDQQREVSAILTTVEQWHAYVEIAPQVRLSKLKFAASGDGQVLVVGKPLPPITGARFWEAKGLLVAAGLHWSPAVDAIIVRRILQLAESDFALWQASGHWELIRQCDFAVARRTAVRATAEALRHVSS